MRIIHARKALLDNIRKILFKLFNSGADFLPADMLKEEKRTGWCATDLMKAVKV